jgi:hypothetical protein
MVVEWQTYMAGGDGSESNVLAILNNRSASTMEININIFAFVHSNLPRCNNNNAVFNGGNMSSASHVTSDYQRLLDILQDEASKGSTIGSWH